MKNYEAFDEYQQWVGQLCDTPIECSIMGLAGEAGEVVDYLKKVMYHNRPYDEAKLVLELGDTLWYLVDIARQKGILMSDVVKASEAKLNARFPSGKFTCKDANARVDEAFNMAEVIAKSQLRGFSEAVANFADDVKRLDSK